MSATSLFSDNAVSIEREEHFAHEGEHRSRLILNIDLRKIDQEGRYASMTIAAHNAPVAPDGKTPRSKEMVITLTDRDGKETILEAQSYRVHPDHQLKQLDGKSHVNHAEFKKGTRITNLNIDYALDMATREVVVGLPHAMRTEFAHALRNAVNALVDEEQQLVNSAPEFQRQAMERHGEALSRALPSRKQEQVSAEVQQEQEPETRGRLRRAGAVLAGALEKIKEKLWQKKPAVEASLESAGPETVATQAAVETIGDDKPVESHVVQNVDSSQASNQKAQQRFDPAREVGGGEIARSSPTPQPERSDPSAPASDDHIVATSHTPTVIWPESTASLDWKMTVGSAEYKLLEAAHDELGDDIKARRLVINPPSKSGIREIEATYYPSCQVGSEGNVALKITATQDNAVFQTNIVVGDSKAEPPVTLASWLKEHDCMRFDAILPDVVTPLQRERHNTDDITRIETGIAECMQKKIAPSPREIHKTTKKEMAELAASQPGGRAGGGRGHAAAIEGERAEQEKQSACVGA